MLSSVSVSECFRWGYARVCTDTAARSCSTIHLQPDYIGEMRSFCLLVCLFVFGYSILFGYRARLLRWLNPAFSLLRYGFSPHCGAEERVLPFCYIHLRLGAVLISGEISVNMLWERIKWFVAGDVQHMVFCWWLLINWSPGSWRLWPDIRPNITRNYRYDSYLLATNNKHKVHTPIYLTR